MHAYLGDDKLWKPLPGYFTPGSPLYNEEGGAILKGPRKLDAAKRLLAESGYAGQPIVSMAAQDLANHKAWGDVTADLLTRLGIKVERVMTDNSCSASRAWEAELVANAIVHTRTKPFCPAVSSGHCIASADRPITSKVAAATTTQTMSVATSTA